MRKTLIVCVCLLVTSSLIADTADSIGQLVAIQGNATATDANQTVRILKLKSPVYQNDKITTEKGARLQIMFSDDSIISQGEESEMILDEYVYSPNKKDANSCSTKMVKGVFRCITGKITQLNPDRFKVKTRMATIGIRGCDVGVDLRGKNDNVLIIEIHGSERVIVDREAGSGAFGPMSFNIAHSGTFVSVPPRQPMDQRPMGRDEVNLFIDHVTPVGAPRTQQNALHREGGGVDPVGVYQPLADGKPSQLGDPLDPNGGALGTKPAPVGIINDVNAGVVYDTLNATATAATTPPPPPPSGGGVSTPSSVFTPRGGGVNWSWGIWETGTLVDSVDFRSSYVLSASQFQTIVTGGTLYNLTGSGVSAAVIRHGGLTRLVEGTANLNVQVGNDVTPNWDGSFSMNNPATDSLAFDAVGTIASDGRMTANETTYNMQINGINFNRGSIVTESINGNLVGSGVGINPITGAMGSFSFDHGTATVNGGFGADLN